jgi:hypothetical protein
MICAMRHQPVETERSLELVESRARRLHGAAAMSSRVGAAMRPRYASAGARYATRAIRSRGSPPHPRP